MIHSQTAALEVLQQICIATDGFDQPGFKEIASKLGVKRLAEITQHEVAAEDSLAWLGEQRTGSLIVALPVRLECTLQLLLHLGVDNPKLVLGLHSGHFMVDQRPESSS